MRLSYHQADTLLRRIVGYGAIIGLVCLGVISGVNGYPRPAPPIPLTQEQIATQATVYVELEGGHGSGVVIGDGLILTNQHVVDDVKEKTTVIFANGVKREARVIWKGSKPYDLALLSADTTGAQVAGIDCKPSQVGREVSIHGHPLRFRSVTTWGRVAALPMNDDEIADAQLLDAVVTGGNSGGGVWAGSKVVGIATAVVLRPYGLGASQTGHSVMIGAPAICRALARS